MSSTTKSDSTSRSITLSTRTFCAAVNWLFALGVAYLLLMSAISHINNPYVFLDTVLSYQLLPLTAAEAVAAFLPFLHITLSICLITEDARRSAFGVCVFLFAVYATAQSLTLLQGLKVDCGCFSGFGVAEEDDTIGAYSIGMSLGCALLSVLGVWATRATKSAGISNNPSAARQKCS